MGNITIRQYTSTIFILLHSHEKYEMLGRCTWRRSVANCIASPDIYMTFEDFKNVDERLRLMVLFYCLLTWQHWVKAVVIHTSFLSLFDIGSTPSIYSGNVNASIYRIQKCVLWVFIYTTTTNCLNHKRLLIMFVWTSKDETM